MFGTDVSSINSSLTFTKDQKKMISLLSIGTFLEYFDLMLYIHMAGVLNNIFFPEADPHIKSLQLAFAFCSTYLMRPVGALIFGWVGDNIGRKPVLIISTFLMSISCFTIAILPTYSEIGISATIILTLCRIIQGMSAPAEMRGAEIYLTESSKPPIQYPLVASLTLFTCFGTSAALGVASIFTNSYFSKYEFAWRIAFLIGSIIAIVGFVARSSLKEANDFVNKKAKFKKRLKEHNIEYNVVDQSIVEKKTDPLVAMYYFFIQCARPPCFYFIYIYCSDILRNNCGFSEGDVINQNFWVSIIDLSGVFGLAYLSYKIFPLKILKIRLYLFTITILLFPFVLHHYNDSAHLWKFVLSWSNLL
jgi:MFS family permease